MCFSLRYVFVNLMYKIHQNCLILETSGAETRKKRPDVLEINSSERLWHFQASS